MTYRNFLCKLIVPVLTLFLTHDVSAQANAPYRFQDLSHTYYATLKDSLQKYWKCPSVFSKKESQKKYQELWEERTNFIIKSIESDNFVHDKEVYDYLDQILSDILKGNKSLIPVKPLLLLDRSATVNAYSVGGNIIAINAGLVTFSRQREELALVIAHELAHNMLKHADNSIRDRAEWLTSDEYKQSLNEVLNSKYERLTRLKRVFERFSFDRNRHNRYHETAADSLAIVFLKNSHIPFNPKFFLRLDSSDNQYKLPLKNAVKDYFAVLNVPYEDWWTQKRSRGLSTRNYNFRDTSTIADSLKTHPDCGDRYLRTKSQATLTGQEVLVPPAVKENANRIVIWNMFDNTNLTACLYRILIEKDKGNKNDWYDFMTFNVFAQLYYADKKLKRFNAIGVTPKEFISKDYLALQNMLEQMPKESIQEYCNRLTQQSFWASVGSDAKSLKVLMNALNQDQDQGAKVMENNAKEFMQNHPSSMYCEFAAHLITK